MPRSITEWAGSCSCCVNNKPLSARGGEGQLGKMLSDVIRDMIGESGDRGTSILEYLTNLALFFADACMILAEREQPQPLIGVWLIWYIQHSIVEGFYKVSADDGATISFGSRVMARFEGFRAKEPLGYSQYLEGPGSYKYPKRDPNYLGSLYLIR